MFVLKNLLGEYLVPLVALIYRNVAKSYNLMIGFTSNNYFGNLQDGISNLQSNLYTLLAIFMVFRITISLLTYLIEPDKIEDSKVGMGKLPMRIAISIILVLTLNSFIFPLLRKVEQALLAPDSIINNIFSSDIEINKNIDLSKKIDNSLLAHDASASSCSLKDNLMANCSLSDAELKSKIIEQIRSYFINDLKRASNNYKLNECNASGTNFPCVEFRETDTVKNDEVCSGCVSSVSVIMIDPELKVQNYDEEIIFVTIGKDLTYTFYKMTFDSNYPTYTPNVCTDVFGTPVCNDMKGQEVSLNNAKFVVQISRNIKEQEASERICYYNYYGAVTKENNGVAETKSQNTNHIVAIKFSKSYDDPQIFGLVGKEVNKYWTLNNYTNESKLSIGPIGLATDINIQNDALKTLNETGNCPKSITNMNCTVNEMTKVYTCNLTSKTEITNKTKQSSNGLYNGSKTMNEVVQKATEDASNNNEDSSYFEYTSGIEGTDGLAFATTVIKSFTDPSDAIEPEFLTDSRSTSTVSAGVGDDKFRMDVIMLVLVGIAAIVMLWVICIEVVVRYLKLALLEVVSPIAVMSYMDPNDKIFSGWVKQYMGAYFNLFIQLLVINAAVYFISVIDVTAGGISTILIYGGIFIFIKAMPGMISKLFGLENMGTFKDSLGMVKKGLGIGAGAVAGSVAGLASGFGQGVSLSTALGGLTGGFFRGAAGGTKGKLFEGGKEQIKRNSIARNSNINGGNATQRFLSKFGMDYATRIENSKLKDLESKQKTYDSFSKYKGSLDDIADQSKFLTDIRNARDKDGNPVYSAGQYESLRTQWINNQLSGKGDTRDYSFKDSNGNTISVTNDYGVEKGKLAGMQAIMANAEAERKANSTINEQVEGPIVSYDDLDKAKTAVLQAKNKVDEEAISIKSSDRYNQSKESQNKK